MRTWLLVLLVVLLCHCSTMAHAALTINGYDPLRHDRFANRPAFIGNPYDWSGVGRTTSGRWGVLVSPSFIIGATHSPPGVGASINFFGGNDPTVTPTTRTVVSSLPIANSDLILSRLDTPISVADGILHYPILEQPTLSQYVGREVYVWGLANTLADTSMRLGRNVVSGVVTDFSNPALGATVSDIFFYDYDVGANGLGADEARVAGGDSGAPSFAIGPDGLPAILGIHWFQYAADPLAPNSLSGSADTLVPNYIAEMNSVMAAFGEQVQVSAVPEPSSLAVVGMLLGLFQFRRRYSTRCAVVG